MSFWLRILHYGASHSEFLNMGFGSWSSEQILIFLAFTFVRAFIVTYMLLQSWMLALFPDSWSMHNMQPQSKSWCMSVHMWCCLPW